MRKRMIIAILVLILLPANIHAGVEYIKAWKSGAQVYIDGELYDNKELPIINYENRLYFPLRELCNRMEAHIEIEGSRIDVITNPTRLVARNAESCVLIAVYKDESPECVSAGSGVILPGGIIATNKHVLDKGNIWGIQYNDTPKTEIHIAKERINAETDLDITFLKSPIEAKAVTLGNSDEVEVGDKVIIIGSPHGIRNVVQEGEIMGFSHNDSGKYLLSDIPAKPGNSGSAAFNAKGEVIGIVVGSQDIGNGYAVIIPINGIKPLLNK